MSIVYGNDMLIPPSLRRKHYKNSTAVYEVSNSSPSNYETPSHAHLIHRPSPREPGIIHQNRNYSGPPVSEVGVVREREYVIETGSSRGESGRIYHRGRAPHESSAEFTRHGGRSRGRRRPRSVGVGGYNSYDDSYSSSNDEHGPYYIDDGASSMGSGSRRMGARRIYRSPHGHVGSVHDSHQQHGHGSSNHHNGRHVAEVAAGAAAAAGLTAAAVHKLRRRPSSTSVSNNGRGLQHPIRDVAFSGLAVAGAKKLYDRREHEHHRHRDSSRSPERSRNRAGHHVAAAALGATTAGLAAHKYAHHHRSQSSSVSPNRRSSSHKLRNAAIGLGAAELVHRHQRSRSRSRPGILRRRSSHGSSSSSDEHGHNKHEHHKLRNAAIGLGAVGAAELARRQYKHNNSPSRSRSRSRPGILHHRRSSSTSSYSSDSSDDHKHGHKLRNAAALGGTAELVHRHHRHNHENHKHLRSPSPHSRPGILRHRSKSVSTPRPRSSSRGASLARRLSTAMSGALVGGSQGENHRRAHSADGRRHHQDHSSHRDSRRSSVHEKEKGLVGRLVNDAVSGAMGHLAYKVGETVAEGAMKKKRY